MTRVARWDESVQHVGCTGVRMNQPARLYLCSQCRVQLRHRWAVADAAYAVIRHKARVVVRDSPPRANVPTCGAGGVKDDST